jgi:hypothetical protein
MAKLSYEEAMKRILVELEREGLDQRWLRLSDLHKAATELIEAANGQA